jgi:murein DD-endopeptidase MepM/ murein hydrolase activator NlpD
VVVTAGRGIMDLLTGAGLTRGEVMDLEEALRGNADFRRCRPGEVITVRSRPDGWVVAVDYRKGPLDLVRAERGDAGWRAGRVEIPHTVEVHRVAGTVRNSLFAAMNELGESDALTMDLVDLLSWEIDFAHESQSGDTFALLVDRYLVDGRVVQYGPVVAATYRLEGRAVTAYSLPDGSGRLEYFTEAGQASRKSFLKSPLRFNRISSGYTSRRRNPVTGSVTSHYAIDYAAPVGTPVWAPADGTVRGMGYDGANGRHIRLTHPGGYETLYLHLSRFAPGLSTGSRVRQKDVIGFVGSTGLSTGPHLDYRLMKHGGYVNPLREEFPRAEPVPPARLEEFRTRVARFKPLLEGAGSPVAVSRLP